MELSDGHFGKWHRYVTTTLRRLQTTSDKTTMPSETPELMLAKKAAAAAGKILQHYFCAGVEVQTKESYNLFSVADLEAERAVVSLIHSRFPSHAIIGEEEQQGDETAEHLWIIDPLDGTNNFVHHIPHFAVSIAYYRAGVPQAGVVFNPIRNDFYAAAKGQGAFANGKQVRVSDERTLDKTLVGLGFYYDRDKMMEATLVSLRDLMHQRVHGVRRMGTASLDLAQVGCGMFGAYFEYELQSWDYAAGRLFVEEAGGRVTDCRGGELPIARTSILATNGLLHDAVLEIVRRNLV